ncbi:MAG TPA: hypothetical protein VMO26_24845 [Vicinamibacterales bacterium]|nr:hypothetical protein [Vicinamibacterales bacterium]
MVDGVPDGRLFRDATVPLIERACRGRKDCVVRAYGEMVDVLWQAGHTVAATKLEMLWNELAGTHDFSLLCGYAMGQFLQARRGRRRVQAAQPCHFPDWGRRPHQLTKGRSPASSYRAAPDLRFRRLIV